MDPDLRGSQGKMHGYSHVLLCFCGIHVSYSMSRIAIMVSINMIRNDIKVRLCIVDVGMQMDIIHISEHNMYVKLI